MKTLTLAAFLIASITPTTSFAEQASDDMEHIKVTYRTPLEYAIYQYTTDTLQAFNQQVRVEAQRQAKLTSEQMAKPYMVNLANNAAQIVQTKATVKTMTLESAE
ncbi:hypothetical protein TUM4438_09870 [Shewanella sairae]|uniref:DUF3316 domain-containing protein n=1 Tax=Shewanella sairae TaxID=190310 RepID=A0ABQ4P5I2_9GAMM|nr:hypothetical protein [Shewanella sairae]MCL1131976.1 hypothetical protein [Shewanella sairae]GIU42688.1 hypothetical protein TUM4438_09870 [Shewanella sairae]